MEKVRIDDKSIDYPDAGNSVVIPLVSRDRREKFILDISRGKIDLSKGSYQNRVRQVIILVRLDFGGKPHRNPDGQEIDSPHLHLFREGYEDKWAIAMPSDKFSNINDIGSLLDYFMKYCNIIEPPKINMRLF
jgi:hypothetical protein